MEQPRRRVYGRRLGYRLRPGRQALLERALPELRLDLPEDAAARIDPAGLFPAPVNDLWLEIGFGAGEHLAYQVRANPAVGVIGCEPFVQGIAGLLRHLEDDGTGGRVRIFPDDARLLLDRLPDACIGRLFVMFPDPWPKKRHHKRRLIDAATLAGFARILKDGAEFRWASDDRDYADWTIGRVERGESRQKAPTTGIRGRTTGRRPATNRRPGRRPGAGLPALRPHPAAPDDQLSRPDDWPETRYEQKARARAGRVPVFLRYVRIPR